MAVCLLCAALAGTDVASATVTEFGSRGTGAGQFLEPNGIAVAQQNGDVYVVDSGNTRLESFGPEGAFLFAAGWGVSDGKSEMEVCTAACRPGLAGGGAGQFSFPNGVVVDDNPASPSFGDVYVADSGNYRVEKFDSTGHFLLTFGKEVNASTKGNVCTSAEAAACGPGQQALEPGSFFFMAGAVGVDTAGKVLVGDFGRVEEFAESGAFVSEWPVGGFGEEGIVAALAVNSANEVYVRSESLPGVRRYSESGTELAPAIDTEGGPRGVTVGPSDEVFIDNGFDEEFVPHLVEYDSAGNQISAFDIGTEGGARGVAYGDSIQRVYSLGSEKIRLIAKPPEGPLVAQERSSAVTSHLATLEAVVDAEGSPTHVHFEYGPSAAYGSSTESLPLPEEGGLFASQHAAAKVSGLEPSTTYHFRVVAEDEKGHTTHGPDATFTTQPPALINSEYATQVTPESARLNAELNPLGTETTYHFEYGTTAAYGESVPIPDASAGAGEDAATRSVVIEHLTSSTTYHYRLVAANALGTVEGPDKTFTTTAAAAPALPDNREWEAVSPPSKDGASLEGISEEGGLIQSAEAGDALTYIARAPVSSETEGSRSVTDEQLLARRQAGGGWSTQDITTKHEQPAGFAPGERAEYRAFSGDLSKAALEPEGATPLAPDAGERTPYRREASGEFTPLVTAANVPPGTKFGGEEVRSEHFAGGVELVGASSDENLVALTSFVPLTKDFTTAELPGEEELPTLYAWKEGALSLVGWLPATAEAPSETPAVRDRFTTVLGYENKVIRHAISQDDQRVIYGAFGPNGVPSHLYLRDVGLSESLQLDLPEAGITAPGSTPVRYQDASEAGSVVFFSDAERLTANASAAPNNLAADLYRCEVTETSGKLGCRLQDISVPLNEGEAADVRGQIVGSDQNGQKVFFVANGVLAPNAVRGNCERTAQESQCNLYMYDAVSKTIKLIAVLSGADSSDWGLGENQLTSLTARVSRNGRYLAFMSQRPLTGFDNHDAASGAPDQEVFEYDSVADTLRCVSCNAAKQRPTGAFDSGQFPGLLVDRVKSWPQKWLAATIPGWQVTKSLTATYQSRYLADNGRLFFNSFDSLVPSDVNGQSDVYEFEPEGVGSCRTADGCVAIISSGQAAGETAFLDASETGGDAFFITKGQLSSADRDNALDVYDAHVCSASAPCASGGQAAPPAPCEDLQACRAEGPPVSLAPVAAAKVSSGNVVIQAPQVKKATRAQMLAKALRSCRRKRGRHRKVCEAQARKRYGAKKHAHAPRVRRHK